MWVCSDKISTISLILYCSSTNHLQLVTTSQTRICNELNIINNLTCHSLVLISNWFNQEGGERSIIGGGADIRIFVLCVIDFF